MKSVPLLETLYYLQFRGGPGEATTGALEAIIYRLRHYLGTATYMATFAVRVPLGGDELVRKCGKGNGKRSGWSKRWREVEREAVLRDFTEKQDNLTAPSFR